MENNIEQNSKSSNFKTGCLGFFILFAIGMWCMRGVGSNENNTAENGKNTEPITNEFPNFKYEIIGELKGFSGNEFVKSDIVFIKVNNCDDAELKYLQKLIQNDNRFPPKIKSGKIEKNVSYEYKIFLVSDIKQLVDLKNVKAIYDTSGDIVDLNNYLRKNTKGFCAMLYKMWDLKEYPTYKENFVMFMRP
jgi:hypothetical protein